MELEQVQMDQETEFPVEVLPQATRALRFIQLQLMELAKDCGNEVQNSQVSPNCFVELEKKLEKVLYETRTACKPPPTKPAKRDFEVIKHVDSGAFGNVDLVRHKKTNKTIAMKQIALQYPSQRDEVLLERDILTYLDHPLVVPLFCSFETVSHMYMAMEYVGGGDLASLLQDRGRFCMDLARFYMAELVLAVEYIHSYCILHRDLKPSNLLISTDGHIKVADFGMSKLGSVSTEACLTEVDRLRNAREFTDSEQCGTSVFMAPELFLQTGYGKPVDWWATGVILYDFLYGTLPFSGWDSNETAELVIQNHIYFPDALSPQRDVARKLISRLLKKDPVRRLGTRGASEVKNHPFFRDVDWKNLPYATPPYVPDVEDTSSFPMCASTDSDDDQTEPPAEQTDFCTVAFRFNKVYGSPMPMSPSPAPDHASPDQSYSEDFESDSEEEDVSNMHVSEASHRQRGRDESQCDSTPSPAPHHASPVQNDSEHFDSDSDEEDAAPGQMDPVEENPSNDLLEATLYLMSIQLQLVELTKACGDTLQNDMVSPNYFVELESKMVKIHQETHTACSPTVKDDSSEETGNPMV